MGARERLWQFIEAEHGEDAGIVYCLSRKSVDETAAWLARKGRTALAYHAGLEANVRRGVLERFRTDNGVIVVATIAFGMGIDKPDVRFVAHLNLPKIDRGLLSGDRACRPRRPGRQCVARLRPAGPDPAAPVDCAERRVGGLQAGATPEARRADRACELPSCRRQVVARLFRRAADAAVRQLRQLHQSAGDDGRHGAGPEGAVGGVPHRPALRRHLPRRRADGACQRARGARRPRQAAGVRHRQGYRRGGVEGRLSPVGGGGTS